MKEKGLVCTGPQQHDTKENSYLVFSLGVGSGAGEQVEDGDDRPLHDRRG